MKKVELHEQIFNSKNSLWKLKSKTYIFEIEKFLDRVQSIKDEELRKELTIQMLKCDEALTKLAEELFKECYNLGLCKKDV